MYPQSVLSKNKKNIKIFLMNIFFFYNFKNFCILHGRVFVMVQYGWFMIVRESLAFISKLTKLVTDRNLLTKHTLFNDHMTSGLISVRSTLIHVFASRAE